ncbi:hypothetical protein FQZ97_1147560 [compost metagenome]
MSSDSMSFSARRTASAVSSMITRLSFSSTKMSLVFTSVRIMVCACFTSVLAR